MDPLKIDFLLKIVIFHCYVNLPEDNLFIVYEGKPVFNLHVLHLFSIVYAGQGPFGIFIGSMVYSPFMNTTIKECNH